MVQFFEQGPSRSQLLGEAFGQSFEKGVSKGISNRLSDMLKEKQRVTQGKSTVQTALSRIFKQFGADEAYDEPSRRKAYDRAFSLLEEGYDPIAASFSAYDELIRPSSENASGQEQQQNPTSFFDTPITKPVTSIINKITKKQPEETRAARKDVDKILAMREKQGRAPYLKELVGLTRDEFLSLPKKQQMEISREVGSLAKEEANRGFTAGLIPGVEKLEHLSARNNQLTPPGILGEGPRSAAKALGQGVQTVGLANVAGIPSTTAGKAGAAAGLFGGEAALRTGLEEGRAPTVGEVAIPAAIGAGAEVIAPYIGSLLNYIKRIPNAFKSVQTAAKAAGVTESEIVNTAAQNVQRRGVDVVKAAEGDASALNQVQKEVQKVSKTFQEAEKFNEKKLLKVRNDIAKKLPESPLEKYYAPAKEIHHRPETLAKEEARIAPLRKHIQESERQLKNLQYSIIDTENTLRQRRNIGLSAEDAQRVESRLALDRMQHQRTLNEIKNAEFEVKYGRPPRTSEEISKDIEKSFAELKEGIKNPKAEKLEKIREKLAKDKDVIETAQKLIARGEIPGGEVFDEYIKIHQQYNKAYGELATELKDFIKDSKGKPRMGTKVENADALLKLVNQMKEAGSAKITNQIDKRRAMRALEQPSGAFYKQMLKDLRSDVDAFQKDFFKWKQIASPQEQITSKVASEKLPKKSNSNISLQSSKKITEDAKNAFKNPTDSNIEKVANEIGIDKKPLGEILKDMIDPAKRAAGKVNAGTATEKDIVAFSKKLIQDFNKLPKLQRTVVTALGTGVLQALAEQYFGYKPTQSQIALVSSVLARGSLGTRGVTGGLSVPVYNFVRNMFESSEAKKLKALRNTQQFNEHLKILNDKYSTAKVNRIKKKAIS